MSIWSKWFSSPNKDKITPLQAPELIFLENELLRLESCLRSEIKELWRAYNDQQAKTLKLEKARGMKFQSYDQEVPKQSMKTRGQEILEKLRRK